MRTVLLLIALVSGLALSSCASRDPAAYDVKSPCVSNDMDGKAPCVRRKPIENDVSKGSK